MLFGIWVIIIVSKFYFTLLLLWLIPVYVVMYAFMVHAFPYCMQGNGVCPPHTGPIIELTGIATTLIFLAGSVVV